jgi:transcriptional regulator with XRE-family HTH domain
MSGETLYPIVVIVYIKIVTALLPASRNKKRRLTKTCIYDFYVAGNFSSHEKKWVESVSYRGCFFQNPDRLTIDDEFQLRRILMPDTLVDLGQRIREERKARQWTLEQFSEKTGLSKSFLSQIERGNAEPSITSLKKIAAQFGYSVVNLFPNGQGADESWGYNNRIAGHPSNNNSYIKDVAVVRAGKRKRIALPGSNVVYDLMTPDMKRKLEVMYMRVSRGKSSGEEPMLDSPGEKLCIVMKGVLELRVGEEVYRLEQGDTLYYPAHVPHSWQAIDGDSIEVIWILTPPSF